MFDIQYYSITQTTLEQIFQKLANGGIDSDKSAITFTCEGESIKQLKPDKAITENLEDSDEDKG